MHEFVESLAGSGRVVGGLDGALEQEFEARLVESSTLAVRVAYSVLHHREDAEDIAQEAFARAYRSFAQLRDRDRFRSWLVRMTWRLAINRWRADRRRSARELAHARTSAPESTTEQAVDERRRAAELWRAIDGLPEKLRIVIVLASIEGHDLGEVGTLLGLPVGTVKSRLFLARQRLKEQLQWTR
jgi:RNA polymerase sigma-70 factor (ECF subfamily)